MADKDKDGGNGTKVFGVRMFSELVDELDVLAKKQIRSRNFLIQQAVATMVNTTLAEIIEQRTKGNKK